MPLTVSKAQVWAGHLQDQPGGLFAMLEPLGAAKANLEFVIARRKPDKRGEGIVYLTPIKGKKAQTAARSAGLVPADAISTLRVEGPDKPGAGAALTGALADAKINVRGVSAATFGKKFVAYIGFDTPEDADKAAKVIRKLK